MADRYASDPVFVTQTAAQVMARLSERLGEVAQSVLNRLESDIVELRGDAALVDMLGASVEGNVDTVVRALRYDIPIERVESPTAALEYARRLAQRGVPANALVRAYRLGHQTVLDAALEEIRHANLEPALSLDVYEWITTVTFRYIDWISQQVTEVYEVERDQWLENRNSVRALRVREVLAATDTDSDAVSASIHYPMRRTQLALVPWFPSSHTRGDELVRLERFVRQVATELKCRELPLFVAADRVSGWGWIPLSADASDAVLDTIRQLAPELAGARIAVGPALPGLAGFRRSHQLALDARSVATVAGTDVPQVVVAADPGLTMAALVGANASAAKVWVAETLGPLAADTENDERLRETLRVFLRAEGSYKGAADELMLHSNSVKYRVQRAIDRRGRPIDGDRLDVEVALTLCHWYGPAMRASGGNPGRTPRRPS